MFYTVRPTVSGLSLIGLLASSSAALSNPIHITRCNALVDGAYVQVMDVDAGSGRKTYQIGESGLTKRIMFSEPLAQEWVKSIVATGGNELIYTDCGAGSDHDDQAVVVTLPPPPPPPPDDGEDTTPGGCGADYLF